MSPDSSKTEMARLRWRSRRGMRELDLMIGRWLDRGYTDATAEQQLGFRRLLDTPDPELYGWLMGKDQAADPVLAQLVELIREA